MATNADRIIEMLKAAGVERLFGMPGGGSNADLIEAAGNGGLPFSLAHTETASAFMACAQAEITGKPGACLATLGPGAASLMNGIAHAHLDRVPLFVLTDCLAQPGAQVMRHQALRHGEMFSSVVKWSARPEPREIGEALDQVLEAALSLPPGPVHLDLSSEVTSSPYVPGASTAGCRAAKGRGAGIPACRAEIRLGALRTAPELDEGAIPPDVHQILHQSRRPVFLLGLGARTQPAASAIRATCERLGIPALVTYKAKGVVPDRHPWFGGVFTNAALESNVLDRADVLVAIGLDHVELLPRPWTLRQPVIAIAGWRMEPSQIPVALELVGDLVPLVHMVAACLTGSDWQSAELQGLVADQRERMRPGLPSGTDDRLLSSVSRPLAGTSPAARIIGSELLPHRVVELVAESYPGVRATVDAGAHMFPVMSLWPVEEPSGLLISNGLSTMGFALPAAIGAALLDRARPIVVFTGDGGLMMCSGELRTAAREKLPVRIIVFQDDELSLIKIKQEQRGYRTDGVTIGEIDWRLVANGFGVRAEDAITETLLQSALRQTTDCPGPVLIAAKISAGTYAATMRALRG